MPPVPQQASSRRRFLKSTSVAKGKQWFHYCVNGVAYEMLWHNRYADADGYEKRGEFQGCVAEFRFAMKPGQRRVLTEAAEGRVLDLIETERRSTSAPTWSIPCRIINYQFGFQQVFYRGSRKTELKLKLLFALAN